jgi:hypothetical protein
MVFSVDGRRGIAHLDHVESNNSKPKQNMRNTTTNVQFNAVWDEAACVIEGAYVIEENGWWSCDGKSWYCGDDDSDFHHTTITLVGGPADGQIINDQI